MLDMRQQGDVVPFRSMLDIEAEQATANELFELRDESDWPSPAARAAGAARATKLSPNCITSSTKDTEG